MFRAAIFLLFLGSGATGLIYQVAWTKLLTLTFGVTLLAVSTVLTCFFGGLALGSFIGGRWVERRNGFFWYGVAELVVGLYALAFPVLLGFNNSAYAAIARQASLDFFSLSILKFFLSLVLLAVPTTLMGATLPLLSKALARSSYFARDVGGLYAINTVGAVAGAVLTAFFLIPSLGMKTILYSAGAFNIAIGVSAILLSRAGGKEAGQRAEERAKEVLTGELPSYYIRLVLLGFAVSGFTGLAYEVIWTRVLGFVLTGTVYAFSATLAVFLTGIAAGSLVFSRFLDRIKRPSSVIAIFAVVEALIGLSAIFLITLYDRLPAFGFYARLDATPYWGESVALYFFTAFITLIIPTFLFGATFPLVCRLYDWKAERVGIKIGNIYSVNTVGGIAGSFVSGFLLVPFLGMQNTLVAMGFINIGLGVLLVVLSPYRMAAVKASFLGLVTVFTLVSMLTLPSNMPLSLHKSILNRGEEILFYTEGSSATVMIAERKGFGLSGSNKRLWVNGNAATAAFYEGLQINRFQGVLPMVLHPDPKEVLVICFGSGTTFGTLSQFPVDRVDNVEIASAVIKGAPYFAEENADVLNNPKARINIDDGRSYLAVTTRKYDVITEEPMHPSLAGVVNLYTREYYELAKAHLKEGGIMSQWIPLYNLSVEDVRTLVRTFQSVFPHTSIWLANTDIFLIGSPDRTVVDFDRLVRRLDLPNVKRLLADIDLEDPYEFLNTFLMNEDNALAYSGSASVMTDDMPVVEFTGPKSLNVNTISPNIAELLAYREPVIPYLKLSGRHDAGAISARLENKYEAGRYNLIGRAYFADSNFPKAAEYFRASLGIDPTDRGSLHYVKKLMLF